MCGNEPRKEGECDMSKDKKFSASQIRELASEGLTVQAMAEKLNVDFEELFFFYADCSAKDRSAYPIRLLVTKSWLEDKIKKAPISSICADTKLSPSAVRQLIKVYKIEPRKKLNEILTPEVLTALFVEQGKTDKDIATMHKCSIDTIKRLRAKYGITFESRVVSRDISIEYFHKLFVTYGFSVKQLALMMNCSTFFVETLQDNYISSDSPLADEIKNRKKSYTFTGLIEKLFEELDPALIYELLRDKSLAEVAEMYGIIPPAINGIETFTPEWLEAVINKMTISDVVKKYHISLSFVQSMMKEHDIKASKVVDRIDVDMVRKLYIENNWSDEQIGAMLGFAPSAITRLRKKHDIRPKMRLSLAARLTPEKFSELYLAENLTIVQIASLFDTTYQNVASLKAIYAKDNPQIASHRATGATDARLLFLKKNLMFSGIIQAK